ncbi:MAG: hypothetical protein NTY35_08780 [Planctomycetota bacterium]|nr:hypothetical protein [Planctomycetota bacterium]
MPERDDGFRRLDEPSPLEVRGRSRRGVERLDTRREDLAPRGAGAILDAGIDALRARFLACFGASVVLWIGPAWLMAFAPPEDMAARLAGGDPAAVAFAQLGASFAQTMISAVVQIFATILVSVILRAEFVGEPLTLGAAGSLVARRFLSILGCIILVGLLSIAGFVACILPYFFLLWRLSLAPLACAAEDQGPAESVARSFALTKGSFLRWAAVSIVAICMLAPMNAVAGGAAQAQVRQTALENLAVSSELYSTILWIAATLFFAVSTAATAAITTAYYYDCRVRREALDLRARLEAIAEPRGAGSPA